VQVQVPVQGLDCHLVSQSLLNSAENTEIRKETSCTERLKRATGREFAVVAVRECSRRLVARLAAGAP
jgi:hypothetical protein